MKNWKYTNWHNCRFKKFPAIAGSSILAIGCITLTSLRLKNWYVLKIKNWSKARNQPNDMQVSQENAYNTQGKNPIILNVRGQQNSLFQIYFVSNNQFETRSHNKLFNVDNSVFDVCSISRVHGFLQKLSASLYGSHSIFNYYSWIVFSNSPKEL